MLHRRPDLIVPIRDRRQRKRYLTLKNFGWASLAAIIGFIGISLRSELRGPAPHGYGRLWQKEVEAAAVEQKPMEVIHEAPPPVVDDATHADPMLIEPAARAQWLEDDTTTTVVAAPVNTASVASTSGDVAIVGGPEGVTVVRKERRKPVLSGGFGRN